MVEIEKKSSKFLVAQVSHGRWRLVFDLTLHKEKCHIYTNHGELVSRENCYGYSCHNYISATNLTKQV